MRILVTGAAGLIGGEVVQYFDRLGWAVVGMDNNARKEFFGPEGDTRPNLDRIRHTARDFTHTKADIRDAEQVRDVFATHGPFDAVVHCAAQPSHDKARAIPLIDFQTNAMGTMHMLEVCRLFSPGAVFVFISSNKVFGDAPNLLEFTELDTRFDYLQRGTWAGFDENVSIDQSCHSVFGASKVAADVMVQEYGRSYGINTVCLRGGCLTGPSHAGVELHGFLSYLVRCCVAGVPYTVFGYEGKQVRDNIHSADVATAIHHLIRWPALPGAVYNIGGGRGNSCSILEAIAMVERITGKKLAWTYNPEPRLGDHRCYITNMAKFCGDYPTWKITKGLPRIVAELVGSQNAGAATERYMPGDGGDQYFEAYAALVPACCRGHVLDLGCGHGWLTERIARQDVVDSILATDTFSGWKVAHEKIRYEVADTGEVVQDWEGPFDTIVSTEHIEHLNSLDQLSLLAWVARVLEPDGTFCGSMPYPDDPQNPDPYHLQTFDPEIWREVLCNYFDSVKVIQVSARGYFWLARQPK